MIDFSIKIKKTDLPFMLSFDIDRDMMCSFLNIVENVTQEV